MEEEESLCVICHEKVRPRQKAMECSMCKQWSHINCANMKEDDYKKYQSITKFYWFCVNDESTVAEFIAEKKLTSKLEKKLDEMNEKISQLCEENHQKMTFAEAAKLSSIQSNNTKFSIIRPKVDKSNGVIVKPKKNSGNDENVVDVVKRKLDLVKIGVGVSSLKPINNGGCFLGTLSKEDTSKVERELISQLGENYEISKPATLQPQLIITGVERDYDQQQLKDEIIKTNFGFTDEDDIKVHHKRLMRNNNEGKEKWLYILQAPEQTFSKLHNKSILVDFNHHFVREYLSVTRCYNCQQYKHKATACKCTTVCGKCAQQHSTRDCTLSSNYKCYNCVEANNRGAKYNVNHMCGGRDCKFHQHMIDSQREKISYPSPW